MRDLQRTPLHALHAAAGAKLVPFAGWEMPLQYEGIVAEHLAVRSSAGLFDVSHMGQLRISGAGAIEAAQRMLSNDLARIPQVGQAQYSMLLNDRGGIEDDLIVYRIAPDELLLVINAANREHDVQLLDGIAVDESDGWSMLALQGPLALDVLVERTGVDMRDEGSFCFVSAPIADAAVIVATTGYTGERGVELLVPADGAVALWSLLVVDERVTRAGLGARDTLRLEACYPLHGSDIDATTDPRSAGLGFAAPLAPEQAVSSRRLVPILVDDRGIPRPGMDVLVDGAQVGSVTSGTMSPVLKRGIALAWLDVDHARAGTSVQLDVRGTLAGAHVVARPFVRGSASTP